MNRRHFFLLAGLAAAVALPMTANFALEAYREHQTAMNEFRAFQQYRTQQEQFMAKVQAYREFVGGMTYFVNAAYDAGVVPERWLEYEVGIKDEQMRIPDFVALLETTRHGPGYYFKPKGFEIKATGGSNERVTISLQGTYLVYDKP